ncbi:MAG: hypothetical protein WDZ80_05695 [Candidatus Paceibacterota bacterium]
MKFKQSNIKKIREKFQKRTIHERVAIAASIFLIFLFLIFITLQGLVILRDSVEDFFEKRFIFNIEVNTETREETSPFNQEDVLNSSFTDLFSGIGWINTDKTTMFQDRIVTSFVLPPDFSWQRISSIPDVEFIEKSDDEIDTRCINGNCLVQNELNLSLNGNNVQLPQEVNSQDLVNISIGNLDSLWLVGFVEQSGGRYHGKVFYLNQNRGFEKLENVEFDSVYSGKIGFGGDDDNFLVIYGGYDGFAYHVLDADEITNVSQYFGNRVMDRGFHPVILKSNNSDISNWYVYSLTEDNPKLIKLFQNGTEKIQGAIDLSDLLFSREISSAYFSLINENTLAAKLIDGSQTYRIFTDNGFDVSQDRFIESININNYPAVIRGITIEDVEYIKGEADIELFVSNDGEEWHEAREKELITFSNRGRFLMWRVEIDPSNNKQYSPFINTIRLYYQVDTF